MALAVIQLACLALKYAEVYQLLSNNYIAYIRFFWQLNSFFHRKNICIVTIYEANNYRKRVL